MYCEFPVQIDYHSNALTFQMGLKSMKINSRDFHEYTSLQCMCSIGVLECSNRQRNGQKTLLIWIWIASRFV